MRFLNDLNIKTKIFGGFGIILFFLTALAIISSIYLNTGKTDFGEYRGYALQTNQSSRVQANTLMARVYVKDFIKTASPESIENVKSRASAAIEFADELEKIALTDADKAVSAEIHREMQEYLETFNVITELQSERSALVSNEMDRLGPEMERSLTEIMVSAYNDNDTAAAYNAGNVMRNLLLGRLYAYRFLQNNDTASQQRVETEFSAMADNLVILDNSIENPIRQELVDKLSVMLPQYTAAFNSVAEIIFRRNGLIEDKLDTIGPLVAEQIEEMKLSVKAEQDRLGPQLTNELSSAVTINIAVALTSLMIGAFAAYTIGNAIAKPIRQMTDSMETLSSGDYDIDIPAQDQKDEIGLMAKSVQFFKDSLVERERLRVEAEEAEKAQAEQERLALEAEQAREAEQLEIERREVEAREAKAAAMASLVEEFNVTVAEVMRSVASGTTELEATAQSMSSIAEETGVQASTAASAAEQASTNVQTVASATEEMGTSVSEISGQMSKSNEATQEVSLKAKTTSEIMAALAEASTSISDIVGLISDIAEQTNLLALNATIEAARAGEAGRGFAVVATEVKSLAGQTTEATDRISNQVVAIQSRVNEANASMEEINGAIQLTAEMANAVAAAIEEQMVTNSEISRSVQEASKGTEEVSANISGVASGASETSTASVQVMSTSQNIAEQVNLLRSTIDNFINGVQSLEDNKLEELQNVA